ncbi:MAG TPA: hypothetical protein VF411_01735 [Bacteroidia bacterium]
MSKSKIHTYEELTHRITELTTIKDAQEIELKSNVKELYESFQLKNTLKNTVKDLANDKEFSQNGFKTAADMATDFIIGKIFNKNNSIKGFITTLLVEKLLTPLIKNNKDKILSFITDLFIKHKNEEESI